MVIGTDRRKKCTATMHGENGRDTVITGDLIDISKCIKSETVVDENGVEWDRRYCDGMVTITMFVPELRDYHLGDRASAKPSEAIG